MAGRELRGNPKIFDGTYEESRGFLTSMRIYLMLNDVRDQSLRVFITLTCIRGGRVDAWSARKKDWLFAVTNDSALLQGQEIWSVFEEDFLGEFVHPVERAKARKEIEEIKMKGVELDCLNAYVQNFRELARKAQYDLDAPHAIHLFLQGLPPYLVRCCVDRDKLSTFEDWVDAAHKYHKKYSLIVYILSAPPLSNEEALILEQAQARIATAAEDRGTFSTSQQKILTDMDKIRYKREGRCFRCDQRGHISRMCPQKEATTSPPVTVKNGTRETQSSFTISEVVLDIRAKSTERRRAFVETIRDDPNFWKPSPSPVRTVGLV